MVSMKNNHKLGLLSRSNISCSPLCNAEVMKSVIEKNNKKGIDYYFILIYNLF